MFLSSPPQGWLLPNVRGEGRRQRVEGRREYGWRFVESGVQARYPISCLHSPEFAECPNAIALKLMCVSCDYGWISIGQTVLIFFGTVIKLKLQGRQLRFVRRRFCLLKTNHQRLTLFVQYLRGRNP